MNKEGNHSEIVYVINCVTVKGYTDSVCNKLKL